MAVACAHPSLIFCENFGHGAGHRLTMTSTPLSTSPALPNLNHGAYACRPCLLLSLASHSSWHSGNSFMTRYSQSHNIAYPLLKSRQVKVKVRFSLQQVPDLQQLDAHVDFQGLVDRAEGLLYTLADAAVATDGAAANTVQKTNGGWFGFLADGLEEILKVLKDGLSTLHIPYAYGFAIIILTVLVKAITFPLTRKQVESTLAMQNLQPKIKAIQERYEGNQERIQLETSRLYKQAGVNPLAGCFPTLATIPVFIGLYQALSNVANEGLLTEGFFWIPSLAGPTTIAARQSGSGISWLFPFVDGHPPLGWSDTLAYLVLPVLLVITQYISMEMMKTPQANDPAQKNTQIILKFLPFMIGYFSLSVPSGLSIYWFTSNVLSTAQQVWLRKLGGAKPAISENVSEIISAGQAKRSLSQPIVDLKEARRGERFRQRKAEEPKRKEDAASQVEAVKEVEQVQVVGSVSGSDDDFKKNSDKKKNITAQKASLEEVYVASSSRTDANNPAPKRSKRSKRRRAA